MSSRTPADEPADVRRDLVEVQALVGPDRFGQWMADELRWLTVLQGAVVDLADPRTPEERRMVLSTVARESLRRRRN